MNNYNTGGYLTTAQKKKLPKTLQKAIANYKKGMTEMMKGGYMPQMGKGGTVNLRSMSQPSRINPFNQGHGGVQYMSNTMPNPYATSENREFAAGGRINPMGAYASYNTDYHTAVASPLKNLHLNRSVLGYPKMQGGGRINLPAAEQPYGVDDMNYYVLGDDDSYQNAMSTAQLNRAKKKYHADPGLAAHQIFGMGATKENNPYWLPGGNPGINQRRYQGGGPMPPQGAPQGPNPSQMRMQQMTGMPPMGAPQGAPQGMPPQGPPPGAPQAGPQGPPQQGGQQGPSQEQLMQLAQAAAQGDQKAIEVIQKLPPQIRQMVMQLVQKISEGQAAKKYGGNVKKKATKKKKKSKSKSPWLNDGTNQQKRSGGMTQFDSYMFGGTTGLKRNPAYKSGGSVAYSGKSLK